MNVQRVGPFFWFLSLLSISLLTFAMGLRSGNPYILSIPVLIPLIIWGVSKPEVVFLFAVAIMNSNMVLPGLPGDLELYHVLFFMVTVILFVRKALTKERSRSDGILLLVCGIYTFIVFYTMMARGIGFRIVGDGDQAGGMRYVLIYLGFLNLWLLPNIQISQQALTRALLAFAILSFIPVLSEGIFLGTGGRIYHQYYFFKPGFGLGGALMGTVEGTEVRYMSAAVLGRGLIYLPFFLIPYCNKNLLKYALFIGMGLLVMAFSGFRSIFIGTTIFLLIAGYFLFQNHRKMYFVSFAVLGLCGYFLAWVGFEYLPFGIQRTVAILPFIGEGSLALSDGAGTMNFRLNVWSLALNEVPDYLWLGRGLAFDYAELTALEAYYSMSDMIFMRGLISNLHNGPLEVLLYLGVPAVLMFISILVRVFQLCIKYLKTLKKTSDKYQMGVYFAAVILSTILLFMLSFGNPYATFYKICLNLSLFRILQLSQQQLGQTQTDNILESSANV